MLQVFCKLTKYLKFIHITKIIGRKIYFIHKLLYKRII